MLDRRGLDGLITALVDRGYRVLGPVVRNGAVVHGEVRTTTDLPVGVRDSQAPGTYRLEDAGDEALFQWAVGPATWKDDFFPPEEWVWRARPEKDGLVIHEAPNVGTPIALFGARPCEAVALGVLDRVLAGGAIVDSSYRRRRAGTFTVVVECGAPASTCFCSSMGSGPDAQGSYDLVVTEVLDEAGTVEPRYMVRAGSVPGREVLAVVQGYPASPVDERRRAEVLDTARNAMTRTLDVDGLRELLSRSIDHPQWEEVARRCLSCGNCTMVCPTCFCSDVHDVSDLEGTVERRRTWASCFDLAHSYIHGGPVRSTVASCYRQWLTHKLGTWWDQFASSGCVGCGRCIAWCPVGIDLTEVVAAIRDSDETTAGA